MATNECGKGVEVSILSVTLIDVGWGDSICIEMQNDSGDIHYGLIDSNDSTYLRSSFIFLKRFFDRRGIKFPEDKPVFDFVMLSHAHTDHGQGLKAILREFGTKHFWYPKSINWSSLAYLIRYSNRSDNVQHHQSIDDTKIIPKLGDLEIQVLWPRYNRIDQDNENNNSIVLLLRLEEVSFVLTGDAESEVWDSMAHKIPRDVKFFKVPHHGSINGTFDGGGNTPWFDRCPRWARLGISSHILPYQHPNSQVIQLFRQKKRLYFRTDEHYHITFETDGTKVAVKYSHL